MKLKPCPVCGNDPMPLCYTSLPPKFGYQHCCVHGGYDDDWHKAEIAWNDSVAEWSRRMEGVV